MQRRSGAALAILAASLLFAQAAPAATEVGGDCVANATAEDLTVVAFSRPANPFPLAVTTAGVVTRWKIQVDAERDLLPQRLTILRAGEKAGEFSAVDESETELVESGANEFRTRIPVRPGDRLGLSGFTGTYFCGGGADIFWAYKGEVSVGETRPFKLREGVGTPVSALVEPDADKDGYGDETQDRCPESAKFHRHACSPVRLRLQAEARKRSIQVRVTADIEVSAQVFGQVGWGLKAKGKRSPGHSKPTRLIVGLRGSTKEVAPGKPGTFRMALPRTVKRRLSRIAPAESLRAEITVVATDADGALAERRTVVRLEGWERG
jgi:hypothetical protein